MGERYPCITLSVPDVGALERVDVILECEARRRDTTAGWAFYLLVNEAVDVGLYLAEARDLIRRLRGMANGQCLRGAGVRPGGEAVPASGFSGERAYLIPFATDECCREVRAVLAYEATVRSLTVSQAACELVEEAARLWSYPHDVLARLHKVDRETERRAAGRCALASTQEWDARAGVPPGA